MKKLLELEAKLRKAREELEKNAMMGYGNDAQTGMPPGTADAGVNKYDPEHKMPKNPKTRKEKGYSIRDKMPPTDTSPTDVDMDRYKVHGKRAKHLVNKEDHEDAAEDKKMIEDKMDEHNEKKHDEPKDEDSAKKFEKSELVKFYPNGQWSLSKATMNPKPDGEFDVPVKEVYDGDDEYVHVGNRGVDNEDHGKTDKISDKEKKALKED